MATFREDRGSTFADTWFRVRDARPRLSPQARIVRQTFGRDVRYIVEEPAGGKFYRLSESAHFFAGFLDGRRTVGEAWDACNAQLGDAAPTQQECIELLTNLQMYGLLIGDQPLAPDMLNAKRQALRDTRMKMRTGNWMFFTVPVYNPQPALERLTPVCKLMFSRLAFMVWLTLGLTSLGLVATRWDDLTGSFNNVLSESNLIWLGAMFLLVRVVHEGGHAMACRAVGARCHEVGIMLIAYVLPLPYCDATDSWKLPRVRDRVLVSAAGVLVETALAAVAALVWVATEPGLAHSLAFNVMVLSGFSTLLFNLNPLLRYDGYYILSDVTGSANLAQRAKELWVFFAERFGFGVQNARPPTVRDRGEAWLLGTYQVLAFPYRMLILTGILLIVAQQYITIGLVLALFFSIVWLIWPLLKAGWYLATSPKLTSRRGRAVGVTAGVFAPLLLLLALVPMPSSGYAPGVVHAADERPLRSGEPGFVEDVFAGVGDSVEAGEVIATISNPRLEHELRIARAGVTRAEADVDRAVVERPTEVPVAEARLKFARERLAEYEDRVGKLRIVAPFAGTITSGPSMGLDLSDAGGLFLRLGDAIGVISSANGTVVFAEVPDSAKGHITRSLLPSVDGVPRAEFRAAGSAGKVRSARIVRTVAQGTRTTSERGITAEAGGDVMLDPTDPGKTLEPLYTIVLATEHTKGLRTGQRVRVRFPTVPEPLMRQWNRSLRRYLDSRLSV